MDVNAEGKRIRETFEGNADKALEKLRKKLEKGTATYADVLKYASETGQEAGRVLAEELPALYPDGVIPEADAARLLPPTLRSNNAMVLEAAGQVQKAKNLKEGVQLNAVLPEYNADYEQMLIQRVAEVVKTDKFWTHTFPQSVENMAMCAVDDTVRANADFQVRSGIHRKIRRQTVGKCCQWCSDLAGTYDYEDVNNAGNDVWRRHKNCDCLIEDVRDGRRGEVFNYREANTPRGRLERERRKREGDSRDGGIDFYTGANKKTIEAKYADWIGENKMQQLLAAAQSSEAKAYIKTDFRKKSFIGDGSTAAIREFELATGLNCGRNGGNHAQKVLDLTNQIRKTLLKDIPEGDKIILTEMLRRLMEVQQ